MNALSKVKRINEHQERVEVLALKAAIARRKDDI